MNTHFDTIHEPDGQQDRQTPHDGIASRGKMNKYIKA